MKRIGLMGGTFDPIHVGHLVAADAARHALDLETVFFIPSNIPPHKREAPEATPEQRFEMVLLATLDHPQFEASRVEVDRPGPSFTIDTLREFRQMFPEAELWFITGADALLEILTWKDARELLTLASFVGATRPGYPLEKLSQVKEGLGRLADSRIKVLEVPALAISSRDLRKRVREGRPIRYMVRRLVERYIYKMGLYGGRPEGLES
ncbi:MAG: nicotinate-nucleotide adenylyltransferase [Clostridiales bacterium]|nr:nicotinate-nucleotide adenylyltransferase [Clostridiales bacterium]